MREKPPSVLDPTDYSAAAWLVACSEHRNRADLWQRTVAAVFLTYCLSVRFLIESYSYLTLYMLSYFAASCSAW